MFGMCKIFHYMLRRITVENRQTYPLVTMYKGHLLITLTNMYINLKVFLSFFFNFNTCFLERVLCFEDEFFNST